jgi:hypothetical protein
MHLGYLCVVRQRRSDAVLFISGAHQCAVTSTIKSTVNVRRNDIPSGRRLIHLSNAYKRLLLTELSPGVFCRRVRERSIEARFVPSKEQSAILILPGAVVPGNCKPNGWYAGNRASFNSVRDDER